MRESGEFGTAKYSPSSLFESGLEAVPLLLYSCINGKHQQRGVVLPTAPAELARGRENLGLQFVGGQRAVIFEQTQQANFPEFFAHRIAGLRDAVGKQYNPVARGQLRRAQLVIRAGKNAQHCAAVAEALVRAVGAQYERRIVAGIDASQPAP